MEPRSLSFVDALKLHLPEMTISCYIQNPELLYPSHFPLSDKDGEDRGKREKMLSPKTTKALNKA